MAADTVSLSIYFHLKFVCWYVSSPASDKLLMLPGITKLEHPKRMGFAAACLTCLSLFATTHAFSQRFWEAVLTLGLENPTKIQRLKWKYRSLLRKPQHPALAPPEEHHCKHTREQKALVIHMAVL